MYQAPGQAAGTQRSEGQPITGQDSAHELGEGRGPQALPARPLCDTVLIHNVIRCHHHGFIGKRTLFSFLGTK